MDSGAEHQQDAPPSLLTALLVHGVVGGCLGWFVTIFNTLPSTVCDKGQQGIPAGDLLSRSSNTCTGLCSPPHLP